MTKSQFEARDAHFSKILLAIAGLLLMLIAGVIFVKLVYNGDFKSAREQTQAADLKRFPQPQPGHFTAESLLQLRAQEKTELESYDWSDDDHTEAKVPIERAIEIYEAHHAQ